MTDAHLEAMPDATLAAWRRDRDAAGEAFPVPAPGDGYEALVVVLDDVEVGGAVLTHHDDAGHRRCSIRLLQTTVPDDAGEAWGAVAAALEQHARGRGAQSLTTAVPPRLATWFQAAGFGTTMTGVALRHPGGRVLAEDGRVAVRAMTDDERRSFAAEAPTLMRAGMTTAGVLSHGDSPMEALEARLAALADDPPAEELLLTAVVDGEPAGRFWATLVPGPGGPDLLGNYLDLFPPFRGQGLTRSFMAAVESVTTERDVRGISGLLYGADREARATVLGMGAGLAEIHLRKDLA